MMYMNLEGGERTLTFYLHVGYMYMSGMYLYLYLTCTLWYLEVA